MFWIVGLWGCINCSNTVDVSVDAVDAAGNAIDIDSGTLTLTDGTSRDLDCTSGDCRTTFGQDEPAGESVAVMIDGTAYELALDGPEDGAECGMGQHQRGTVVVP